jgi:hypothetical protein
VSQWRGRNQKACRTGQKKFADSDRVAYFWHESASLPPLT